MLTLTTTHGTFNGTSPNQIAKREYGTRAYVSGGLIIRRNRFRRTDLVTDRADHVLAQIIEIPEA